VGLAGQAAADADMQKGLPNCETNSRVVDLV
jgi:hypothetical protein